MGRAHCGTSAPDAHSTTSERGTATRPSCGTVASVEATFLAILICVFLALAVFAAYAVARLTADRD